MDDSHPGVLELNFFYHQYEVPVRKHVYAYDRSNLISDIGGYLGLLLGYSILTFYDMLVFVIGEMVKIILTTQKGSSHENPPKAPNLVG